jgi:hypothetical protein
MLAQTTEFSVILRLDESASRDINRIRTLLPASNFRDDPPHVTLLKGIHSRQLMSDDDLLKHISPLLNRLLKGRPVVRVSYVANLPGGVYRDTSAVVLISSSDLQRQHISLIAHLRGLGFRVDKDSLAHISPHATVRLGVPFDTQALDWAEKLFPKGRGIELVGWEILRLEKDIKSRPFYELAPGR